MTSISQVDTPALALTDGQVAMDGYEAVKYNALKHGILSKHVVLPHENKNEFDDLQAALISEHQPAGATELHLVEELAGIMWRKRRVLLAEGAKINRSLRVCMHSLDKRSSTSVKNAVPAEAALAGAYVDYRDLLSLTEEELRQREQDAIRELAATERANQVILGGRGNVYKRALKMLPPESLQWWGNQLDDGEVEATVDSLKDFIAIDLLPACRSNLAEIQNHEAIKSQVFGEGINMPLMQNLSRYETHLDRKFEKTLGMLIKLKELRGKK